MVVARNVDSNAASSGRRENCSASIFTVIDQRLLAATNPSLGWLVAAAFVDLGRVLLTTQVSSGRRRAVGEAAIVVEGFCPHHSAYTVSVRGGAQISPIYRHSGLGSE